MTTELSKKGKVPTVHSLHGALCVISHLPSGLNVTPVPNSTGSSASFTVSLARQTWAPR